MSPESTCWSLIHGAAAGNADDRAQFAHRYTSVVRSYLCARWRGSPHLQDVEDAVQEVFVACFQKDGVLARAAPARGSGFRPYLYAVTRNVARRIETGRARAREQPVPDGLDLDSLPDDEPSLSQVFDRAWALALVREAARHQDELAR